MAGTYQTVARVGEIPEGEGRPFEVDGRMIAVIHASGAYYAIEDQCPHQGAPLWDGVVADRTIACAWHGWQFRLEDGCWLDSPRTRIATYPVRVEGDEIRVLIEER